MQKAKSETKRHNFKHGFTLIELLIVIGIIAVLAAFAFVALNPLARFADSRNARRWSDVNMALSALKLYQVDNDGRLPPVMEALDSGVYYQIGTWDNSLSDCHAPEIELESAGADLTELVTAGYLPSVPVDPKSEGASEYETHYYFYKSDAGIITIGSCSEEQGSGGATPEIYVSR